MLPAKDAVKVSLQAFADLFPGETYRDLRLEEVALNKEKSDWKITVSFKNPDLDDELKIKRTVNFNPLSNQGAELPSSRHYKSIVIDAADGSLVQIASA